MTQATTYRNTINDAYACHGKRALTLLFGSISVYLPESGTPGASL